MNSEDSLHNLLSTRFVSTTNEFVFELNTFEDPFKIKGVEECIKWYTEDFSKKNLDTLLTTTIREYASLANLKISSTTKELMLNWVNCLIEKCKDSRYERRDLLEALEHVLQSIDLAVLEDDSGKLLKIAQVLLSQLNADDSPPFVKVMFPSHGVKLMLLHQIMFILQQNAPDLIDPAKDPIYYTFKNHLQGIQKRSRYYPFEFLAKLIEQSIQRLENKQRLSPILSGCRRLASGVYGILRMAEGVKSLFFLGQSDGGLTDGLQNVKTALTETYIEKESWYGVYRKLAITGFKALLNPNDFDQFEKCFIRTLDEAGGMNTSEIKCLRYGIIDQLQYFCLANSESKVRKLALVNLCRLTRPNDLSFASWKFDPDIVEALLEALYSIYGEISENTAHSETQEKAVVTIALVNLSSITEPVHVKERIDRWLNGSDMKSKLNEPFVSSSHVFSGSLFQKMREALMLPDRQEILSIREELKTKYRSNDFKLSKLLGRQELHDVSNFEYHLTYEERIECISVPESSTSASISVPATTVATPIAIEDLFKDRCIRPSVVIRKIEKVLIVGNPGVGKTSLGKKLAKVWTEGKWGQQFEAVYHLIIRELDFMNFRREHEGSLLASVIANKWTPGKNGASYQKLQRQIDIDLMKKSTLVIVDGLDEAGESSKEILRQVKKGQCCSLLLSRPCAMDTKKQEVDIVVECRGLNNNQVLRFVDTSCHRADLASFLKENPILIEIAQVPVNLHFLCALWKDNDNNTIEELTKVEDGALLVLYERMANILWTRFVLERYQNPEACKDLQIDVFSALQRIAFEAQRNGRLFISQSEVQRLVTPGQTCETLMETGFLLLHKLENDNQKFQFPHKRFQEYFTALHLANLCDTDPDNDELTTFVSVEKYREFSRDTLIFTCQKLASSKNDGLFSLLSILDQPPVEVLGMQHLLLKLKLVDGFLSCAKGNAHKSATESLPISCLIRTVLNILSEDGELATMVMTHLAKLPHLVKSSKDLCPKIMEKVTGRVEDLRWLDLTVIAKAVRFDPGCFRKLENALLRSWNKDFAFRYTTVKKIAELIVLNPKSQSSLIEIFFEACRDPHAHAFSRGTAIFHVPSVAKALPQHVDELMQFYRNAFEDDAYFVRANAAERAVDMIEVAPTFTEEIFSGFVAVCTDPNEDAQRRALTKVPKMMEAAPQYQEILLKLLFSAATFDSWKMSFEALCQLRRIDMLSFENKQSLIDKFVAGCVNENLETYLSSMGRCAEVLACVEGFGDLIFSYFFSATESNSNIVRMEAVRQIGGLLRVIPEQRDILMQLLLEACADEDNGVKNTALELLKSLPSDQLIDMYWISKNEIHLSAILSKLLQEPAIAMMEGYDVWKLSIFSADALPVEWVNDERVITSFVQHIQSTALTTFPMLQNLIKFQNSTEFRFNR